MRIQLSRKCPTQTGPLATRVKLRNACFPLMRNLSALCRLPILAIGKGSTKVMGSTVSFPQGLHVAGSSSRSGLAAFAAASAGEAPSSKTFGGPPLFPGAWTDSGTSSASSYTIRLDGSRAPDITGVGMTDGASFRTIFGGRPRFLANMGRAAGIGLVNPVVVLGGVPGRLGIFGLRVIGIASSVTLCGRPRGFGA